jgi:hypothetical protein
MRALKLLVIIMGVLLVGGTVALTIAIVQRVNHRRAAPPPVAGRGFDHTVIDLPAGARVLGSEAVGDRLAVRIALADGGEALILIDPRTGARLGTIELRAAAPGENK